MTDAFEFARIKLIYAQAGQAERDRADLDLLTQARAFLLEMVVGDRLEVQSTRPLSPPAPTERKWTGDVVAIAVDSEGDPLIVLEDSRGLRSTINVDYACQRDVMITETLSHARVGHIPDQDLGREL